MPESQAWNLDSWDLKCLYRCASIVSVDEGEAGYAW